MNLIDLFPDDQVGVHLWANGRYYSSVKEASAKDGDGDSFIALQGLDGTLGTQDQWSLGGAIAELKTSTKADFQPLARFDLEASGVGPAGYIRYTPYSTDDRRHAFSLRVQAVYLFLDNDSENEVFGFLYHSGRQAGRLFAGDVSATYKLPIASNPNDVARGTVGLRYIGIRYSDTFIPHRNDGFAYLKASVDHEFAYNWLVTATGGVEVPLDHFSVGVVALTQPQKDTNIFCDYELGLQRRFGDTVIATAALSGSAGPDFHEIGGLIRLSYKFDDRVRN